MSYKWGAQRGSMKGVMIDDEAGGVGLNYIEDGGSEPTPECRLGGRKFVIVRY